MSHSVRELVDRSLAGDRRAGTTLAVEHLIPAAKAGVADIYHKRVPRRSWRPEDVEELTNDVLAHLFSSAGARLKAWDPHRGDLSVWVKEIARNYTKSHFRKAYEQPWKTEQHEPSSEVLHGDADNGIEPEIVEREFAERLVDQLDETDRELFQARFVEDQNSKEIAAARGMTPNNVDTKISRLRKRLEDVWKTILGSDPRPGPRKERGPRRSASGGGAEEGVTADHKDKRDSDPPGSDPLSRSGEVTRARGRKVG
jgi:RNA polymerase sigma-70 factor (ECF subfamily)